jgi:hypothetical protein
VLMNIVSINLKHFFISTNVFLFSCFINRDSIFFQLLIYSGRNDRYRASQLRLSSLITQLFSSGEI